MPWLPGLNQIEPVTKHPALGSSIQAMSSRICPRCGRKDVRQSNRRGVGDRIIACFGLAPFRCRACRYRFFRFPAGNDDGAEPAIEVLARTTSARPVVAQSSAPQRAAVVAAPVVAEHPLARVPVAYSLLIVSRDPAIRKLLCKLLAQPGYYTHELADAVQLSSELRARKVDLLIADLDEPEQQGLQDAAALRSVHPNLKIIALSGLRIPGVPGSIVLPKPFRREMLLENVQKALADGVGTPPPSAGVPRSLLLAARG